MCLWVLLQVLSFFFQHLPVIIDFLNCIVLKVLNLFILLLEKFLQFDWLEAVVFQLNLNLKYLRVKNYKPFAGSSINK